MTSADWRYFGETVAIGSSTGVWLYHADDVSEPFHQLPSDSASITAVRFSHDSQQIMSGSDDGTIRVWSFDG